ncbi:MAG: alpha-glucan family phosphorylase, partial [Phycisphaerae bacterium]|nr:alpha-glucan family phosphorylase [Phycisphaerae bacterium]
MPKVRNFTVLPALPDSLKNLDFIARNLFWSWNPEFVELFKRIDPTLWNRCSHNPVKMLGSISQHTLDSLAENHGFINELNRAADKLKSYLASERWFDRKIRSSDETTIAYFSAEFGIHESLPIYSGGLGVLAGDHLKSASDLGIPMVAVGLLYQKGYFRQYLNTDGWQQEVYVENDFYSMPVNLVKDDKGKPVTIKVDFPGRSVTAQIWRIDVGRIPLYMLDTNVPENTPEDRMITANLYGGDLEMRISQEIMLGIGGLRALHAVGINPNICHMN